MTALGAKRGGVLPVSRGTAEEGAARSAGGCLAGRGVDTPFHDLLARFLEAGWPRRGRAQRLARPQLTPGWVIRRAGFCACRNLRRQAGRACWLLGPAG